MQNAPTSADPRSPHGDHATDVQPGLLGTFDSPVDIPGQLASQAAQLHELRAETERLRADRDRLAERQRQIGELLRSANHDKILHDLRNVLNELQLYKMLVETQEK